MTYNQYRNILSFSILILYTNDVNTSPDYYLEKVKHFLGDISFKKIDSYNQEYHNIWGDYDEKINNIIDLKNELIMVKSLENGLKPFSIINAFENYFYDLDKILNIIKTGLNPILTIKVIDRHLEKYSIEMKQIKRLEVLNKTQ